MSEAKRRRPPLHALIALEVIAKLGRREFSWWAFKTAMPAAGHTSTAQRALDALERRGWVEVTGETIVVTDAGFRAATTGEGVPPPRSIQRRTSKTRHNRLPHGLF